MPLDPTPDHAAPHDVTPESGDDTTPGTPIPAPPYEASPSSTGVILGEPDEVRPAEPPPEPPTATSRP